MPHRGHIDETGTAVELLRDDTLSHGTLSERAALAATALGSWIRQRGGLRLSSCIDPTVSSERASTEARFSRGNEKGERRLIAPLSPPPLDEFVWPSSGPRASADQHQDASPRSAEPALIPAVDAPGLLLGLSDRRRRPVSCVSFGQCLEIAKLPAGHHEVHGSQHRE
jgi:hypothetical protein